MAKVKLKEIAEYVNDSSFKYWILISYKESIKKEETFKEAILINVEEFNYLKGNIFKKENLSVKLEIEEIRTINFPLGSFFDSLGNLILTPTESSTKKFVYKNNILIDPYKDFVLPFDKDEIFNTDFINGVPCYYKKKENSDTTFIIPVHSILDFFFYRNTYVTNILVNNFMAIHHLNKMDENVLSYPSTIINKDSAKNLGRYFFTKYNAGYRALMRINDHQSEWLNQAKSNKESKAYINTNLPFGIKSYLSVNGIYLTDKESKDRKFLVFSIEEAKPLDRAKLFFETSKIILFDLTDKTSTDLRDSKEVIENNSNVNIIGSRDNNEDQELSTEPVNNSLPEVEDEIIKNRKFNLDPEFEKLERLDQLNKHVTNTDVIKEINELSLNYNEQAGNSDAARYQAVETESFSFFKVFFKAVELLRKEGYATNYLTLDSENSDSTLTIAPSGIKVKKSLRSLIVSICQIQVNQLNYVIIESGENHYIGMFACTNNYSFNLVSDIRIKDFLGKVINIHGYNWSKVNTEENFNFQKGSGIKIFRPIEHAKKKSLKLLGGIEKKRPAEVISILGEALAYKIKNRVLIDIKENY